MRTYAHRRLSPRILPIERESNHLARSHPSRQSGGVRPGSTSVHWDSLVARLTAVAAAGESAHTRLSSVSAHQRCASLLPPLRTHQRTNSNRTSTSNGLIIAYLRGCATPPSARRPPVFRAYSHRPTDPCGHCKNARARPMHGTHGAGCMWRTMLEVRGTCADSAGHVEGVLCPTNRLEITSKIIGSTDAYFV